MNFAAKLAREILEMEDRINFLEHENTRMQIALEQHQEFLVGGIRQGEEMICNVLGHLLDKDSDINRTARIVQRARLAGISEE